LLEAYAGRFAIGPVQLKCREEYAFAGLRRAAGMPPPQITAGLPVFGAASAAVT